MTAEHSRLAPVATKPITDQERDPAGPTAAPAHGSSSDGHYDRIWSAANSAGPASPASPASAGAGGLINTQWWVDYETVGGKTTKLPDRYGADQMIVEQLKIHRDGEKSSEILRGGNMAKSGNVFLGTARMPKGPGTVSASVRYAKKPSFDVRLTLSSAPSSRSERAAFEKAKIDAKKLIMAMIEDRGDYAAMAIEVRDELAGLFPGKTLTVNVNPLASGAASESYTADAAVYDADSDSKYVAVIDPTGQQDQSTGWTDSHANEEHSGEETQSGNKVTTGVDTKSKTAEKKKFINAFKSSMTSHVQAVFKVLQDSLHVQSDTTQPIHEKTTTWSVGVGPDKPTKDGDKAAETSKPSDGGWVGGALKVVSKAGRWVYNAGKNGLKKIPLIGAALELGGSIFELAGKASVTRGSVTKDGHTDTHTTSDNTKLDTELNSLSEFATSLSSEMISETEKDVEREVSTSLGTEVTEAKKQDGGRKTTGNHGSSGTVVTHEVGKPRVFLKKL
ncbi:MAG: hypothetical protein H0T79_02915 [Deltaproteobacteria bacterium]|nr:hypothetical protein [Deltaproteobacteria bacterium]